MRRTWASKRGGREIWNYTLRRQATRDGVDAANEDANQNQKADGDEKAATKDNGVHRRYRHTGASRRSLRTTRLLPHRRRFRESPAGAATPSTQLG